jgi:Mn-dependent DtxR family transcriptional regulator
MRGPQRQTDLANILGLADSTISYHLKLLEKEGAIAVDERKFYMLAEEGDVEETILSVFKEHGPFKKGDLFKLEELAVFGAKVHAAYRNLITKGLLVEQDENIRLTRWGTNRLNVCYVCCKPVTGLSTVSFVIDMLFEHGGVPIIGDVPERLTAVLIHPKCFRKLANQLIGEYSELQIPDDCFCDYCGLPLSIGVYRMLVENIGVSIEEMRGHLLKCENEITYKMQKPWPLFTSRENVEELVTEFEKEAKKKQIDYDRETRERELWSAAQSIIREKEERLDEIIRASFGPIETAYSKIITPWQYTPEEEIITTEEEFITTDKEKLRYASHGANYGMVFIGKNGERLHPLCASLLNRT